MFEQGFCVDLETTIASKVPDSVRPKGQKRFETRIIEIGAVHVAKQSLKWGCIVNPLPKDAHLNTAQDLIALLRSMYQRPDATIDFWSKVLVKRKSLTHNMFLNDEPPEVWLNRTTMNRAKDFVRWHNLPESGPKFVTETQALRKLVEFTQSEPTWYAHNGRSFDFKILKGCGLRCGIRYSVCEIDTLREFRKRMPGHKSYSQPTLYRNIFKRGYNAHVAIDDATALSELCCYVKTHNSKTTCHKTTRGNNVPAVSKPNVSPLQLPAAAVSDTTKTMNLTFRLRDVTSHKVSFQKKARRQKSRGVTALRGIGTKTAQALSQINIATCQQLKAEFDKRGVEWLQRIVPKGVRWRVVAHSIASFSP